MDPCGKQKKHILSQSIHELNQDYCSWAQLKSKISVLTKNGVSIFFSQHLNCYFIALKFSGGGGVIFHKFLSSFYFYVLKAYIVR